MELDQIQREVDRILLDYPGRPTAPHQIQQIDQRVRVVLDQYGDEYSALFDADDRGCLRCTVFHRKHANEVLGAKQFLMTGDWVQFLAKAGHLNGEEVKPTIDDEGEEDE